MKFVPSPRNLLLLAVIALLVWGIYSNYQATSPMSCGRQSGYGMRNNKSRYMNRRVERMTGMPMKEKMMGMPQANGGAVMGVSPDEEDLAPVNADTTLGVNAACAVGAGTGLASSLLPREVASTENFGEFVADDVLKGVNLLDPRQQIGFPEVMGGALRNANQQIRAEPPNPKKNYVWQNSTIVPDLMQRKICT